MNRVRKRPGNFHARPLSADDLSMPGREDPSVPRVNKPIDDRVVSPPRQGSSGTVADRVDQASPAFSAAPPPGDRVAADEQDCPCEREPGEVELDLREIDFLLQEALANGGKASRMSTSKSSGVEHVETENGKSVKSVERRYTGISTAETLSAWRRAAVDGSDCVSHTCLGRSGT